MVEILRFEAIAGNEIDSVIQDAFKIVAKIDKFDANRCAELDENIHVTIRPLFIAGVGAEHSQILYIEPANELILVRGKGFSYLG